MGQKLIAQTDCSNQLRLAQRLFDDGLLEEIPQLLQSCLITGFTKEEKIAAYKMIVQVYLFTNAMEQADEEMLRFLREFPNYRVSPGDPSEFVNLHSTYRTEPVLQIETFAGASFSHPYIIERFGVESLRNESGEYSSLPGVYLGASYTRNLSRLFVADIGISLAMLRTAYSNALFPHTSISANLSDFHLGIPLSVRYNYPLQGFVPFLKGGVEPTYLLYSSANITRSFTTGADPITGTVNLTANHKRFDVKPFLGVGVEFSFGNTTLIANAGFRMGTIVPTQRELIYSNPATIERYYFVEDRWIANQTYITISYIFSIYNPVKIK